MISELVCELVNNRFIGFVKTSNDNLEKKTNEEKKK